jgi:hypothetical protein
MPDADRGRGRGRTDTMKTTRRGPPVPASKLGYYTQDTGQSVYHYFMGDEPPKGQYIYVLRDKVWEPLTDSWYLMDMVINGEPDLTGPMVNPPAGVPAFSR